VIITLLPLALKSLLEELVAQPLPATGAQGNFTRITSRIRSSLHPEVLILQKTCSDQPSHTPPTPELKHVPLVYTPLISSSPPDLADPGIATLPEQQPIMSLLHRPGRPLTMADFPPSQTPLEADLLSPTPEDAPPYLRRFLPDPLTLPMDESRLPPIGIWP